VHPFRAAIETGDLPAALALLAEDVVFRSPVVFRPYHGRAAVAPILAGVVRVFEDFRYVREIGAVGARDHALVFEARVGNRHLEGCDFLHTADDGLIDEFAVMVRPLSAALALAEAMKAQLDTAEEGTQLTTPRDFMEPPPGTPMEPRSARCSVPAAPRPPGLICAPQLISSGEPPAAPSGGYMRGLPR
jgi:hypothetical protein